MALLLSCRSLSRSFGGRPLFNGITLGIEDGERIGLIGPNGAGKTTFLRIVAGLDTPDSGDVSTRRNLRVAYVAQADVFAPKATARTALLDAIAAMPLDDHEREDRVRLMLAKLGVDQPDQPAEAMSGGWRKRLSIARELLSEPDLLLLDEPTNHLDLEGILWLERVLRAAPFGLILVSHDRRFLEVLATRTIEMNRAYPEGFLSVQGSYSRFLEEREGLLEGQAHAEVALSSRVRREIEWLRQGAKARTTKAQARIGQAERMIDDLADLRDRNSQDRSAGIDFSATGRKTRELLSARGLAKSVGGRQLFSDLDLDLAPGSRLGLVGPNGSGKTTLLRTLVDDLPPDAGAVKHATDLSVVYFEQARSALDPADTLRQALSPAGDTVIYRGRPMHVAGWARRFLFDAGQLERPIGTLSGGEQARVLIARLMLRPADVLVLDEPTNDLDIPTLEVLEDSLLEFPGALVLVTHDRYLLDRICDRLLVLDGEGGATFVAGVEQWERLVTQRAEGAPASRSGNQQPAAPRPKPVRLTTSERKELANIESDILAAEDAVAEIERKLSDPAVGSDAARLRECWEALPVAKERVAFLYARWQELEEKQQAATR
jgi:ABC transport system ATP-binding/permease protein